MVNKKLKRFEEKHTLVLVFVVLAVLVLGGLFIMKPKMTGYAVSESFNNQADCEIANYTWTNITTEDCTNRDTCLTDCEGNCSECEIVVTGGECSDSTYDNQLVCEIANYTWTNITTEDCTNRDTCLTDCEGNCSECEIVVTGGECTGEVCGDGACEGNENTASCLDDCPDTVAPVITLNGDSTVEVPLDDSYTELGATAIDNVDGNLTVTDITGEIDVHTEGSYTVTYTISDVVGNIATKTRTVNVVEEEESESTTSESTTSEIPEVIVEPPVITGAVTTLVCTPNWNCGSWTDCVEGSQIRDCSDINNCGSLEGKPAVSQSCQMPETCSDGIENQDEKGIDCGGVCEQKCSIFTIMGNAVNVPVNSSKQFVQDNKIISFSILGIMVLAVSWVFVAKFALKKKTFFFLEGLKKLKFFNKQSP